jgi:hypothetical protein
MGCIAGAVVCVRRPALPQTLRCQLPTAIGGRVLASLTIDEVESTAVHARRAQVVRFEPWSQIGLRPGERRDVRGRRELKRASTRRRESPAAPRPRKPEVSKTLSSTAADAESGLETRHYRHLSDRFPLTAPSRGLLLRSCFAGRCHPATRIAREQAAVAGVNCTGSSTLVDCTGPGPVPSSSARFAVGP